MYEFISIANPNVIVIAIIVKNLVYKSIFIWTQLNVMLFRKRSKVGVFETIANANTMPNKMKNTSHYKIAPSIAIFKKLQAFVNVIAIESC